MSRFFALIAILAIGLTYSALASANEPTPMDAPLAAGDITVIASPIPVADGQSPEKVALMHYRLYLPADYDDNGNRKYPVMFIAAPGGNARMGEMQNILVRERWIVAMLFESRNGSSDWLPNFMAAYDDLVQRVRSIESMHFCTGFSGAAKVCSVYPGIRPGFRGMILQGAGPWGVRAFTEPGNEDLLVYGTFGTLDGNFHHARRIRLSLPPYIRRLVTIWDGGHAWAPAHVFESALRWLEHAALTSAPYAPELDDAYQWFAENRLSDVTEAESDIARFAALEDIRGLPPEWRNAADSSLVQRVDAAFANAAAPTGDERAAYEAFRAALRDDEADHGRNSAKIAETYESIADQFPDTMYGLIARDRGQAVYWETGQYP